jgi:hypothetical protein
MIMRFLIVCFVTIVAACQTEAQTPPILVDQFGYLPELQKRAIIKDPQIGFDAVNSFQPSLRYAVIDLKTGKAVFEGRPKAWNRGETDSVSGDRVWWFDFTAVTKPGRYVVRDLDRKVDSYAFEIGENVYAPVLKATFKTLYLQRAGFEKSQPFTTKAYLDKASHLKAGQDPQARLYSAKEDASTERDLRGGWYDAGDYNQYTSWTANYVTWLLAAYLENPAAWGDDFDIPESGNGVPDILDEVKWGLDWLERMQNSDGSMLSVLSRAEGSPPSKAKGPSYYGPANTSGTVTSAGAFAMAAKVFSGQQTLKPHAERYADRAKRAWSWAEPNPNVKFYNNDEQQGSLGLAAGQQEVESDRLQKKSLIAAVHMYALTEDDYFEDVVSKLYARVKPMAADTPNGFEGNLAYELLYFSRLNGVDKRFARTIKRDYDRQVLNAYNAWEAIKSDTSAYGAYVDGYWWGSNSTKSRRGSVYTQAVIAGIGNQTPKSYLNAALGYVNYLHGVNPLGKTYLSNMSAYGSENSVNSFYHAWFVNGSKDFDDVRTSKYGPAPGFLVGGPNPGYERDACCAEGTCGGYGPAECRKPILSPPSHQPPSKSYADFNDGWPLNSWSVTENSNSYQIAYLRLLSKFVR